TWRTLSCSEIRVISGEAGRQRERRPTLAYPRGPRLRKESGLLAVLGLADDDARAGADGGAHRAAEDQAGGCARGGPLLGVVAAGGQGQRQDGESGDGNCAHGAPPRTGGWLVDDSDQNQAPRSTGPDLRLPCEAPRWAAMAKCRVEGTPKAITDRATRLPASTAWRAQCTNSPSSARSVGHSTE